jgi:hypothetical protein
MKSIRTSIKSRHLARGSVDIRYALIEACAIGVFSALAALFDIWRCLQAIATFAKHQELI